MHTTRKLEQCSNTCAELRESLTLAQDTVSTNFAMTLGHMFPVYLFGKPAWEMFSSEVRIYLGRRFANIWGGVLHMVVDPSVSARAL